MAPRKEKKAGCRKKVRRPQKKDATGRKAWGGEISNLKYKKRPEQETSDYREARSGRI